MTSMFACYLLLPLLPLCDRLCGGNNVAENTCVLLLPLCVFYRVLNTVPHVYLFCVENICLLLLLMPLLLLAIQ